MEKAEVLSKFFASVFNVSSSAYIFPGPQSQRRNWGNEVTPIAGEDKVQNLRNLNVHNSMRPDEVNSRVLKELADEVAKPLSLISEDMEVSPSPQWLKKREISHPFFKKD